MAENSGEKKSYEIKFEQREGYMYVYGKAKQDSFEISLGFWMEIVAYCKENSVSKVLVEEDFGTDNSMMDTYEIMVQGQKNGFIGVRIAFVDRHPDHMNTNLFAETVALNRGIIAKVFSNIKEAEEWLLS
jgi:hypothetical protein